MAAFLAERNIGSFRLDTGGFPQSVSQSLGFSQRSYDSIIEIEGQRMDLNEVRVVWNHRQLPPRPSEQMAGNDREFALGECMHLVNGLWFLLRDRFWVNPLQAAQAAENKPYQLKTAASAGFEIPRTLMTNDPAAVLSFFDECQGRMIYKTFHQYNRPDENGAWLGIYTNLVSRSSLLEHYEQIRLAPCIFQEYVPKQIELRVIAIGHEIFTMAIDAQKSPQGRDDWRRFDYENTTYEPFELPKPIQALIHDLMKRLDLVFAGIDLVLTPNGRFVFLEINQVCQWQWMESITGLPLLQAFGEMLIQAAADGKPQAVTA